MGLPIMFRDFYNGSMGALIMAGLVVVVLFWWAIINVHVSPTWNVCWVAPSYLNPINSKDYILQNLGLLGYIKSELRRCFGIGLHSFLSTAVVEKNTCGRHFRSHVERKPLYLLFVMRSCLLTASKFQRALLYRASSLHWKPANKVLMFSPSDAHDCCSPRYDFNLAQEKVTTRIVDTAVGVIELSLQIERIHIKGPGAHRM
jgi:hypothetical protein